MFLSRRSTHQKINTVDELRHNDGRLEKETVCTVTVQ